MTTGIVVAMSSERVHLEPHAAAHTFERNGPWRVDRYTIAGHDVVAVTSGIGMANAAAATEFLIQTERPERIVNFGCAGAHRRDLVPGDVIIATNSSTTRSSKSCPAARSAIPGSSANRRRTPAGT